MKHFKEYSRKFDDSTNAILGINIAVLAIIIFLGMERPYTNNETLYKTSVWILMFCGILGPMVLSTVALLEVKYLRHVINQGFKIEPTEKDN